MTDTKELLSFIHKNAAMGVSSIPQSMSLPQSRAMQDALQSQLQEYRSVTARCQAVAKADGITLKPPSPVARAMSSTMLRAQTMMDPSTSKLAELMIQGNTMGTIQMTRRLHQYGGKVNQDAITLGQQLLRMEAQNIQEMKRFL